jgi:hypothetical protein
MKIAQQKELLADCLDTSRHGTDPRGSRMSEPARKYFFSAIADRAASAAARFGSRKLWRSCNRAGLRLIAGWTPAKRSVQVRNLVTLLGLIIALVTALSIPIGYGIIGYLKEANALTYKAELSAARAAQYI